MAAKRKKKAAKKTYKLNKSQQEYLNRSFDQICLADDVITDMQDQIRRTAKGFAAVITFLPPCQERRLALECVESAMLWATFCIAREQKQILDNLARQREDGGK